MVFNVQLTGRLLAASLLCGVLSASVYDVFRAAGAFFPQGKVLVFVRDVAFCASYAAAMCVLFYNFTGGRIRLFAILASAAGFAAYYFTIGRLTKAASERLHSFLARLCARVSGKVSQKCFRLRRIFRSACAEKRILRMASDGFGAYGRRSKR